MAASLDAAALALTLLALLQQSAIACSRPRGHAFGQPSLLGRSPIGLPDVGHELRKSCISTITAARGIVAPAAAQVTGGKLRADVARISFEIAMMRITDLPDDCLLACLARCPYADLRNAVPSTCKQLRDAVASSAFRKLRGVWLGGVGRLRDAGASTDACFLITKRARRVQVAPWSTIPISYYVERPGAEVIVISGLEPMRARATPREYMAGDRHPW